MIVQQGFAVIFHTKGLIVFALFIAALSLALIPKWGIIAAGCLILIDWLSIFAGGWGRSAKPTSRSSSH